MAKNREPRHPNGSYELLELQIKHEKEMRELEQRNALLNTEKQNIENLRRLEELNHAHANAMKDRAELLQKSTYEQFKDSFDSWKLEITTTITSYISTQEGRLSKQDSTLRLWGIALMVVTIIINIVGVVIAIKLSRP